MIASAFILDGGAVTLRIASNQVCRMVSRRMRQNRTYLSIRRYHLIHHLFELTHLIRNQDLVFIQSFYEMKQKPFANLYL